MTKLSQQIRDLQEGRSQSNGEVIDSEIENLRSQKVTQMGETRRDPELLKSIYQARELDQKMSGYGHNTDWHREIQPSDASQICSQEEPTSKFAYYTDDHKEEHMRLVEKSTLDLEIGEFRKEIDLCAQTYSAFQRLQGNSANVEEAREILKKGKHIENDRWWWLTDSEEFSKRVPAALSYERWHKRADVTHNVSVAQADNTLKAEGLADQLILKKLVKVPISTKGLTTFTGEALTASKGARDTNVSISEVEDWDGWKVVEESETSTGETDKDEKAAEKQKEEEKGSGTQNKPRTKRKGWRGQRLNKTKEKASLSESKAELTLQKGIPQSASQAASEEFKPTDFPGL